MKINIIILVLVVGFTAIWSLIEARSDKPNSIKSQYNDFTFRTLEDETHTFYDYKDKGSIVHLWATWCAPCIIELPELIKYADQSGKQILAFAVQDKPEEIEKFTQQINIPIPSNFMIGLDNDKQISARIFNTEKLPESYIFDKDLVLKDKIIGMKQDWVVSDVKSP